jgi:lambda family phage minor tail protein L
VSTPLTITTEIQKLEPSAVIELFVLDCTDIGGDVFRFHAGTNELSANITWQGNVYTRFPIQASGFEVSAQGSLPRPRLRASNVLSVITTLLLELDDLAGAAVYRKRTLKKYLDAVNFEGGVNLDADPDAHFVDDKYYVDRKITENRDVVEFELSAAMDLAGISVPRRQVIANLCSWEYRGGECGYTDTRYFKADDSETTDSTQDKCGKRLSSCKKRFGTGTDLPFGGFPGSNIRR